MSKFFLAIYDYLSRHKILAAAILVVCVGLSVWLSLLLHYEENITDFLPKSKENAKYTSVYESIGDQGRITLIFRADTSLADSEDKKYSLMDAVDAFEENWYKYAPDSVDVDLQCHTDESAVFDALDFLRDNVAIFLTDDDYDRIDSLLSIDGYVDTCMQNVKRMLSFPMSSVAVEAITADPLNLFSPVLQRLSVLDVSGKYQVADGYLFDDEGNAFAFMSSPYASSDTKANAVLSEAIDSAISATMAQVRDVRVSSVGAPIIAVTNASQIKRDSIFSISIAIFLIMAILLFAMGYWRNIL
ncbi:MAG: 1-acyl-sn-glycerol-3-phosphate acyltransferase, partial [Bacteroidales bacterium]|nr:1-acyl-sn-glycerol-3-phosphate acyltransferase [Bacteroidales bacterium]